MVRYLTFLQRTQSAYFKTYWQWFFKASNLLSEGQIVDKSVTKSLIVTPILGMALCQPFLSFYKSFLSYDELLIKKLWDLSLYFFKFSNLIKDMFTEQFMYQKWWYLDESESILENIIKSVLILFWTTIFFDKMLAWANATLSILPSSLLFLVWLVQNWSNCNVMVFKWVSGNLKEKIM